MSLLAAIQGDGPVEGAGVEASVAKLCAALLAENRLPPAAVVAARVRIPDGCEPPLRALAELGLTGIPIFWEAGVDGGLRVIAHVRVKRRRRLRPVVLASNDDVQAPDPEPEAGTPTTEPSP
ncbi:hypothetical protein [Vulgatibacter incomptus]|uniref:Uncharacterized protein n=1 Tax=Vulgatibacter incomptus TaxID=1391653 RepID=A0A0K1PE21_9BACT|nr:hypothetical protein [Vulgatibacter incomptus]AKU91783.1 hypothetical protein AKJ08_2170 [Vulgatibacter incomptus]